MASASQEKLLHGTLHATSGRATGKLNNWVTHQQRIAKYLKTTNQEHKYKFITGTNII